MKKEEDLYTFFNCFIYFIIKRFVLTCLRFWPLLGILNCCVIDSVHKQCRFMELSQRSGTKSNLLRYVTTVWGTLLFSFGSQIPLVLSFYLIVLLLNSYVRTHVCGCVCVITMGVCDHDCHWTRVCDGLYLRLSILLSI